MSHGLKIGTKYRLGMMLLGLFYSTFIFIIKWNVFAKIGVKHSNELKMRTEFRFGVIGSENILFRF
jgi:hypothetical protein